MAALAAGRGRRGDPPLLLPVGGRPLYGPDPASLSAGLGRALHLLRARGQRLRARPDAGDDPEEGQARRDRIDQPRIARRRPSDARLRARAGAMGQGPDDRGDLGDGEDGLRIDGRCRDPRQRAGGERRLAPRPRDLRLRDRLDGPEGRAGARRACRMPHLPPDPRRLGGLRSPRGGRRSTRRVDRLDDSGRPA